MSLNRCDCGSTDCSVCGEWQGTYCPDRDILTDRCTRTGRPCSDDCPDVPEDEDDGTDWTENDYDPDDCLGCGVCDDCIEATRAYCEADDA